VLYLLLQNKEEKKEEEKNKRLNKLILKTKKDEPTLEDILEMEEDKKYFLGLGKSPINNSFILPKPPIITPILENINPFNNNNIIDKK
jgi:hypothetical protein